MVYFFAALIKHEIRMKCEKYFMIVLYFMLVCKNTRKCKKCLVSLRLAVDIGQSRGIPLIFHPASPAGIF